MKNKKIGVVMGGPSAEREVSVQTGTAIYQALKEKGYDVELIDLLPEKFYEQLKEKQIEVVFNAIHGLYGEDGRLQGYLDMMGIAYTGSGIEANALAMDKIISKQIFLLENIPTPRFLVVKKMMSEQEQLEKIKAFGLPIIIKPVDQGSTIGVTKVWQEEEIVLALQEGFKYSETLLIEELIAGREFTVAVLGDDSESQVFPAIEIIPHSGSYDYHAKYTKGATTYAVPAQTDEKTAKLLKDYTKTIYQIFGCRGVARADYMLDKAGNLYVLEINTVPGMTETSLVPKAAAAIGLNFTQLCEKILAGAK